MDKEKQKQKDLNEKVLEKLRKLQDDELINQNKKLIG